MEYDKPKNHEPQTAEEAMRMLDEIEAEIQQEIGADYYETIQNGQDSIKEYKQQTPLASNKNGINSESQNKKLYTEEGYQFLKPTMHQNTKFNINEPRLEDYNLTQETYNNEVKKYQEQKDLVNNKLKDNEKKIERVLVFIFLFSGVIGIIIFSNVGGIIFGLIFGYFIARIIEKVYKKTSEKNLNNSLNKINDKMRESLIIQRYYKYSSALHDYYIELNKYQKRIQMLKEKYWIDMEGHKFEKEIAALFSKFGYHTKVTKGSGDGGVDIILTKNNKKYYVQCKNHKNPVAPATARDLFGAMNHDGIKNGVIVSTMGFTKGVFKFVEGKNIKLISLKQILKMVDHIK